MSHWVTKTSNVLEDVNANMLHSALTELGFGLDSKVKSVRNSYGSSPVDAGITKGGKALSLGFQFVNKDGKTNLVLQGDFWSTGVDQNKFMDQIAQTYMKQKAIAELEARMYNVDSIENMANGNIEINAYVYA